MNNKILGGILGASATIIVGVISWGYNISNVVAVNVDNVNRLEKSVDRLTEQYRRYDAQLAALIHRQDVRISLLEQLVKSELEKEEGGNHGNR